MSNRCDFCVANYPEPQIFVPYFIKDMDRKFFIEVDKINGKLYESVKRFLWEHQGNCKNCYIDEVLCLHKFNKMYTIISENYCSYCGKNRIKDYV